jgi:hypothetical protein
LAVVLVQAGLGKHPTMGNQKMLLSASLHESLPSPVDKFRKAGVLRRMLHPRPTKRPKPESVISALT